jgi:biotin carboxyl carrier protein
MQAEKYQLTVNEKHSFELEPSALADAVQLADGSYHLLHDGRAYTAEVVGFNFAAKQVSLRVNGRPQLVTISDGFDQLVKKMGLSANVAHRVGAVKAPMPGLVLNILVEAGQPVQQGDPLLILEAMKMENVIKSPGEGVVSRIVAEKGKPVDKGQVLIEL